MNKKKTTVDKIMKKKLPKHLKRRSQQDLDTWQTSFCHNLIPAVDSNQINF